MRVCIYARVSTKQDQSTQMQLTELNKFVESKGWNIVHIYEDQKTGTNVNREGLQAMLRDAKLKKFDAVLVYKMDRFARSLKDLINMLQELNDCGVQFVSLKDNLDLTTSAGRLMMGILGAFSEFEASLIRERVRSGMANAKTKGVRLGRPSKEHAEIKALRAKGLTHRAIAEALGISKGSVQNALRSA